MCKELNNLKLLVVSLVFKINCKFIMFNIDSLTHKIQLIFE